jgi:hypothetical protein
MQCSCKHHYIAPVIKSIQITSPDFPFPHVHSPLRPAHKSAKIKPLRDNLTSHSNSNLKTAVSQKKKSYSFFRAFVSLPLTTVSKRPKTSRAFIVSSAECIDTSLKYIFNISSRISQFLVLLFVSPVQLLLMPASMEVAPDFQSHNSCLSV